MGRRHYGTGVVVNSTAFGDTQTPTLDLADNLSELGILLESVLTNGSTAPTLTALANCLGVIAHIQTINIKGASGRSVTLSNYGLLMAHLCTTNGRLPFIDPFDDVTTSAAVNRKAALRLALGWPKSETTLSFSITFAGSSALFSANAPTSPTIKLIIRPLYAVRLINYTYLEFSSTMTTTLALMNLAAQGLLKGVAFIPLSTGTVPDLDLVTQIQVKHNETVSHDISELAGLLDIVGNVRGCQGLTIAPDSEPFMPQIGYLEVDNEALDTNLSKVAFAGSSGTLKLVAAIAKLNTRIKEPANPPASEAAETGLAQIAVIENPAGKAVQKVSLMVAVKSDDLEEATRR